jgi:plasmid stabilization system protein ParE
VNLVVQPEAETDIVDAAVWYGDRSPAVCRRFLQTLEAALATIELHPLHYQTVYGQVRRMVLRGFPYALLYVASKDEVNVIACVHGRRDPKRWRGRVR